MTAIEFIALGLATWRLSHLFADEKGPFDMFVKIRIWLYTMTLQDYGRIWNATFQTLNNGIHCMWCNSVWFGSLLSVLVASNLVEWILFSFASSAITIFLEEIINGNSKNSNTT